MTDEQKPKKFRVVGIDKGQKQDFEFAEQVEKALNELSDESRDVQIIGDSDSLLIVGVHTQPAPPPQQQPPAGFLGAVSLGALTQLFGGKSESALTDRTREIMRKLQQAMGPAEWDKGPEAVKVWLAKNQSAYAGFSAKDLLAASEEFAQASKTHSETCGQGETCYWPDMLAVLAEATKTNASRNLQ